MSSESRRNFLRRLVTLASGGLLVAGLGDYLIEEFRTPPSISQVSTSSKTTTSANLLPDYLDFLNWLKSAAASLKQGTINVSLEAEFLPFALQARGLDFFRYSGINDQFSVKPYALQLSDINLLVHTQSPTYDVFSVDNQNIGLFRDFVISPLELATLYPDLTYPQLNVNDFSGFVWDYVATYPPAISLGKRGSSPATVPFFPLDMPLLVLFYRTDIYAQQGLTPPRTWDEYFANVVALSEAGKTRFGTVNMAAPDISIIYEFASHLASFGAKLFAVDGNSLTPTIDSPEVLQALENFVRFQPYSDISSSVYTWGDVFTVLAHGNAATGLLWHDYKNWLNDPSRSGVAGRIGMAPNPAGPKGSFSTFGGAGIGVSRFSKNPKAAWLWLQWATAKGTQETLLLDETHVYPSRESVLSVPAVASQLDGEAYASPKLAKDIWSTGSVTALLEFPKWFQVLDSLSLHLNKAWLGAESPSQALRAAQQQAEAVGTLTF